MTAPHHRWSYSLRALFVVVTLFACWLGYQLNWIRERHALLGGPVPSNTTTLRDKGILVCQDGEANAPLELRLLGERGCYAILTRLRASDPELARIRELFPESIVEPIVPDRPKRLPAASR